MKHGQSNGAPLGELTSGANGSSGGNTKAPSSASPAQQLNSDSERRRALTLFKAHADATNDIFHVAARVVAGVLIRARAELAAHRAAQPPSAPNSPSRAGTAEDLQLQEWSQADCWRTLQAAWLPQVFLLRMLARTVNHFHHSRHCSPG